MDRPSLSARSRLRSSRLGGVPTVQAATAPAWLGLPPGRLSTTVRQTGFA